MSKTKAVVFLAFMIGLVVPVINATGMLTLSNIALLVGLIGIVYLEAWT